MKLWFRLEERISFLNDDSRDSSLDLCSIGSVRVTEEKKIVRSPITFFKLGSGTGSTKNPGIMAANALLFDLN